MSTSTYYETIVLNMTLRGQQTVVGQIWVALFDGDPDDGLSGEFNHADYQRAQATFDPDFTNNNRIVFPIAASSWGTLNYVVLTDHPTKGAGNILAWDTGSATSIGLGDRPVIEIDGIVVSVT